MSPRSRTLALVLLATLGVHCTDDTEDPARSPATGPDASTDGQVMSPGTPSGPDAATLPPAATRDASIIVVGAPDAAVPRDSGIVVIEIPVSMVACGSSSCAVKDGTVCCESWSKATGFGAAACVPQAMCASGHSGSGDTNRMVTSTCDDRADCSAGQVCCYVRLPPGGFGMSQPFCDGFLGGCGADVASIAGPGASRACQELSACNSAAPPTFGTGYVSCTSAADCADGQTCQPEVADAQPKPIGTVASTQGARPYAQVCR